MLLQISEKIQKGIFLTFLILTIATPLLFSTNNSELFEVPKMIFVYLGATIILSLTLAKFTLERQIVIPKNPLVIILATFVFFQIVSTFFSIDNFTSVFGFPTRLNGGVVSQLAFFVIFTSAFISLDKEKVKTLLLAFTISAFVISLWGIPSHFGKDPNCLVLTGNFNSGCWQKEFDPRDRIFSTLGQPNWLASYLILALPISIFFAASKKNTNQKIFFLFISATQIIAIFLTNSLSGFIGLFSAASLFLFLSKDSINKKNLKLLAVAAVILLVLTSLYGKTLFSRISNSSLKALLLLRTNSIESLEIPKNQGTPSFIIRLIVWQGAIGVIKNYPLLGSGPETFAYSYYMFRPLSHNQTSEWNFFYNKAHNEILNTFANLGILGGIIYLAFIFKTIALLLKKTQKEFSSKILSRAIASAIFGYIVSLMFGFSIVPTQLMFFILISSGLIFSGKNKNQIIKINILKKAPVELSALIIIAALTSYLLVFIGRIYAADIYFQKAKNTNFASKSINYYTKAINAFPTGNPLYLSESAYTTASALQSIEDLKIKQSLENKSKNMSEKALSYSPNNLLITRRVANSYFLLSQQNPQNEKRALEVASKLPTLAPTDPQSYLTLAKIQAGLGKEPEAQISITKALELKPDYLEAIELQDQIKNTTFDN